MGIVSDRIVFVVVMALRPLGWVATHMTGRGASSSRALTRIAAKCVSTEARERKLLIIGIEMRTIEAVESPRSL